MFIVAGASALGGMYHGADEAECARVVQRAVELGINLIDTAPWYGHGVAEQILGRVRYRHIVFHHLDVQNSSTF